MKKTLPAIVLTSALTLAAAGCATGGLSPREAPGRDVTSYMSAAPEIASLKAKLRPADANGDPSRPLNVTGDLGPPPAAIRPASVVIVQVGEVAPPSEMLHQLRGRPELFSSVQSLSGLIPGAAYAGQGLQEHDRYGSSYSYSRPAADTQPAHEHLADLLGTADQMGADYLLVYGGTVDVDQRDTPWGLLDLTLVGAFTVPSRVLTAEGKASGVWMHVDSGRVVATSSADESRQRRASSAGVKGARTKQMRGLRDELIEELTGDLIARFEQMGGPRASARAEASAR